MEPFRLNPQAILVAQMKDQVLVKWLEKRLAESSQWSGRSTAFILSSEMLNELMTCFQSLDSHAKLKIIMAYAYVNPRFHSSWRESMLNLIGVARRDADDWVEIISELLRDIPTNSQIQTTTEAKNPVHEKFMQDVEQMVNQHNTAGNLKLNPKSYDMAYVAVQKTLSLNRDSSEHFKIVKKPKSFLLCQDVLKQSEIANSLKKDKSQGIITSSMPLKFRNTRREANLDLPMRGIPTADTVRMSAGFSNEPKKFQRQLSKRDGGAKLLDITDLPTPLKKRRMQQQEDERKKKIEEKEQQRRKQAEEKRVKEEAKKAEQLRIQEEKRLAEEKKKEDQAKNEELLAEKIARETKEKAEKEKCVAEMLEKSRQNAADLKHIKSPKGSDAQQESKKMVQRIVRRLTSETSTASESGSCKAEASLTATPIQTPKSVNDDNVPSTNYSRASCSLSEESMSIPVQIAKPVQQVAEINNKQYAARQVFVTAANAAEPPPPLPRMQPQAVRLQPPQTITTEQLQRIQTARQNSTNAHQEPQQGAVRTYGTKPNSAPMLHHPPLLSPQQHPGKIRHPRTNVVPQAQTAVEGNSSHITAAAPVSADQSHSFTKNNASVKKGPQFINSQNPQIRERLTNQELPQQANMTQFSNNGNLQFVYANGQPITQEALFRQHEMQVQKQCDSILSTANAMDDNGRHMVKQFMLGNRVNPRPDLGNVITLKLSEVIQDDIDNATGQTIRMKIETFFQMDYMNGEWKRLRKCRPFNMTMLYPGNHVY